ncbi:hypothetical protein [Bacillus bombysepticus]|uniref:hypothetical protein n=1 Tax=Bacillus bombysepticus TaxID=658666 RepID=UPI003015C2A2
MMDIVTENQFIRDIRKQQRIETLEKFIEHIHLEIQNFKDSPQIVEFLVNFSDDSNLANIFYLPPNLVRETKNKLNKINNWKEEI